MLQLGHLQFVVRKGLLLLLGLPPLFFYGLVLVLGLVLQLLDDVLELAADVVVALARHFEVFVLLRLVEQLFLQVLDLLLLFGQTPLHSLYFLDFPLQVLVNSFVVLDDSALTGLVAFQLLHVVCLVVFFLCPVITLLQPVFYLLDVEVLFLQLLLELCTVFGLVF